MSETPSIETLSTVDDFSAWLLTTPNVLHTLYAYAEWHEPCRPGGALEVFVQKMCETMPTVEFAKINAEEVLDVAETLDVSVVPTFYFFKNKSLIDKVEGADPADVIRRVERWAAATSLPASASSVAPLSDLTKRIEQLITASSVMLFMKGKPDNPKCKFSRKAVELLQGEGISFGSFDILNDPAVRAGLKDYADWPTYPQLWVNGKLIGGVDIMQELKEADELASLAPKTRELDPSKAPVPPPAAAADNSATELTPELTNRLKALVNRSRVMLFMKGSPDSPSCGFSNTIVELLRANGVVFDSFDILSDPAVRNGLKQLYNWPTYPQLYVNGELIGGLDIVKAMVNDNPDEPLLQQLGLSA